MHIRQLIGFHLYPAEPGKWARGPVSGLTPKALVARSFPLAAQPSCRQDLESMRT